MICRIMQSLSRPLCFFSPVCCTCRQNCQVLREIHLSRSHLTPLLLTIVSCRILVDRPFRMQCMIVQHFSVFTSRPGVSGLHVIKNLKLDTVDDLRVCGGVQGKVGELCIHWKERRHKRGERYIFSGLGLITLCVPVCVDYYVHTYCPTKYVSGAWFEEAKHVNQGCVRHVHFHTTSLWKECCLQQPYLSSRAQWAARC